MRQHDQGILYLDMRRQYDPNRIDSDVSSSEGSIFDANFEEFYFSDDLSSDDSILLESEVDELSEIDDGEENMHVDEDNGKHECLLKSKLRQ